MSQLTYVTGGSRSGKSRWAQEQAEQLPSPRAYLATCPRIAGDAELDDRIMRHQRDRAGRGWNTVECPENLPETLKHQPEQIILVDCLTLWINNRLFANPDYDEDNAGEDAQRLAEACHAHGGQIFIVSNEVGSGIVPGDLLTRRYRDCIGRANQRIAQASDRAVMLCSGLPLFLKGNP